MKRLLTIIALAAVALTSCKKADKPVSELVEPQHKEFHASFTLTDGCDNYGAGQDPDVGPLDGDSAADLIGGGSGVQLVSHRCYGSPADSYGFP